MIDKIKEMVVNQLGVSVSEIKLDSDIVKDLDADSLDIVEMIIDFELEFNVEISNEEFEKVSTIEDIVKFIESKAK